MEPLSTNEKLLEVLGAQASLMDAFRAANDVLSGAVKGIADLIMNTGSVVDGAGQTARIGGKLLPIAAVLIVGYIVYDKFIK